MQEALELVVTCLACGEQWYYAVPGTLTACLSLMMGRRRPIDKCPCCGAHEASFKRCDHRDPSTS